MVPGEILFLCHRIPFPPDRGDKIRSSRLLHAMAEIAPVHVGCFGDDERDLGFAADMAGVAASQCVVMRDRSMLAAGLSALVRREPALVSVYRNRELHRWVRDLIDYRPIRAIVAYSVQMAQYVADPLPPDIRFLMDFVDFDSAKYAAYGAGDNSFMGWVNRREGRVLHDYERAVARRANLSTFISAPEADAFRAAGGVEGCAILPLENGVDFRYFDPGADYPRVEAPGRPLIVFTGQMDYRPNIEAVESFARGAMPRIRRAHPDALLAIVGRNPAREVKALSARPGVIVTGAVDDVRGWLAAADVVVAPLRTARGVQNKVLEAMAMGRPVVASPQAAEGIDARPEEHLIVADVPMAEADAVLSLLEEPDRAAALGRAARARIEQRYDWAATLAPLRDILTGTP